MDDGDATVREKSFEAFGVLIGVVSERALQGYIAKLDKIKEKRVREFIPEGPVGIAGPVAGAPAAVAPAPIDAAALADIASSINSDKPAAKKKAAAAATAAPKKAGSTIAKPSGAAAKSSPTRKSAAAREDDNDNGTSVDASGRMDISSKITPKLLQTLDDSDWKKRHEALTQVEQILIDANKKIQPKIGNLFVALKSRLTDSNKNLVQVTLNLLGDFASAIGSAVEPHMKMIVPNIFVNFTDGKQNVWMALASIRRFPITQFNVIFLFEQIRDAAALCLDKWVAEVTMDPFVAYLHNAINQPSGRKELLTWMGKHFANISKKVDLKPLIKDVLLCIDDKSKEVRSLAEPLLAEIARRGNSKTIEDQISKLKPATAAPIRALLANLKATTPTKSTAAVRDRAPSTTTRLSDVSKLSPTESDGTSPAASPRSRSDSISETPPASMGPIRRNTGKAVREKSSAVPSIWFFDSVAPQLVEALENQARECFSEELLTKLFGSGVGEYFEGLTELESHIEFSQDAVIDSLDVLLKWSSIRLFESNIPLQRKVISLVSNLLGFLEIWKHTLSDYEAQSFVLVFIERMVRLRFLLSEVFRIFTNFHL
jgi:cytoskeleton-associated protein 5